MQQKTTQPPNVPITTPQEQVIYIYYYDGIDAGRVKTLMALISGLIAQEKPTSLYFLFASRGGHVDAGVTFFNFLKSLPVKIITA